MRDRVGPVLMLDRRRVVLGGVAVALVALLALASTAVHAAHALTRLTSARQSVAARANNAYFACLEAQARSLIVPGDVVYLLRPTLGQWVTMTKVIGGWADVTLDLGASNTAARLERVRGPGTCNGTDIQIIHRFSDGRVLIQQGLQGAPVAVSTGLAVALTLLVLAAAGALPVLATVGPRLVALPLFPLAGAVLCAVSAGCSIALAGSLVMWFVIWSLAAAAVSGRYLERHPHLGRAMARAVRRGVPRLVGAGAVAVLLAVAWTLRTLSVPNVGYDTRTIWLIHARWLTQGHAFALAAARNHFLVVTHPGYPPLISSVMALAWRVSGTSTDRVAVVMVAMLNACALLVAGWGIVEASRRGAVRLHGDGRRQQLLLGAGIVTAVVAVVVAGGVLGTFFTNGYADPLWSLAAVSVVVYGLTLPMTRSDLAVAAVMIAVAGLTKIEGTAVALVLLGVITGREVARRRALAAPPLGPRRLSAVLAAVLGLLAWPVLTELLGMPTDPSLSGVRQGSLASRAHGTFSAMVPHLHVLGLAALCSVAGFLLLRPLRARLGLGHDGWTWVAVVAALFVLGGAYVVGPGNVELWLDTSVNRTTIFVALLGWWIVALWAFCGSAGASTYVAVRQEVPAS